jgi:hypothetical protein
MSERKSYRNFKKRGPEMTTEQKIEQFVLRNSSNGFFTKVSTIHYKFEISEDMAWTIVGELLSNGSCESTHDEYSGEMKLCAAGKTYHIMDLALKRKRDKYRTNKKP